MEKVSRIMQAVGYERAMAVHGYDGQSGRGPGRFSEVTARAGLRREAAVFPG